MRKCVIILTPDEEAKADIQTGGVTSIEILDNLKTISSHFARQILEEYSEITGDRNLDESKIEDYMNFLRKNQV